MSSGIYVATAGAVAQSNALDATANNIANASTAGFHGDKLTFREALSKARSPDVALVIQPRNRGNSSRRRARCHSLPFAACFTRTSSMSPYSFAWPAER